MRRGNGLPVAAFKAAKSLYTSLPILAGVILVAGLAHTLVPRQYYFSGNSVLDSLVGSGLGSILAGNPVTSYLLAGEMLRGGASLLTVTAFLVAWVTVGLVQLPAEAMMLGRKFALTRNLLSFVFSLIVAASTTLILGLL